MNGSCNLIAIATLCRQLVDEAEELVGFLERRFGKSGRARCLRLRQRRGRFVVRCRDALHAVGKLSRHRLLVGKIDLRQVVQSGLQRRHFSGAGVAEHLRHACPVGLKVEGRRRAVDTHVIERREQIALGIGGRLRSACRGQPAPGFPCGQRQHDDNGYAERHDDGFQKCTDRHAIKHRNPQAERGGSAADSDGRLPSLNPMRF